MCLVEEHTFLVPPPSIQSTSMCMFFDTILQYRVAGIFILVRTQNHQMSMHAHDIEHSGCHI